MAYENAPLAVERWTRAFKAERAKKASKPFQINLASFFLDSAIAKSVQVKRAKGRVDIVAKASSFNNRVFAPKVKAMDARKMKRMDFEAPDGFRPMHLDFRALPAKLAKELVQANRVRHPNLRYGRDRQEPTTVFSPDDRYTFNDTAFPWCTCGLVETAAGWGSGVMIGPRHLMTASHVVNWGPNNTAGWLKFTPLSFDGNAPFGSTHATLIYSWLKADGSDGLNADEGAFDYVVCVMNSRMGDITGWMGSRQYSTSWNGGSYWGHIGYPSDLSSGSRPAFIGYQPMDSTITRTVGGRDSFRISHKVDVIPGQSGGPYFGWWANEPWPRVIGIQSGQSATFNTSGGGGPLPELINFARNANP